MPDWVDLGFHLLLAGQNAKNDAAVKQLAQAATAAQQQTERENLGRQLLFDLGEALKKFNALPESAPEGVYVVLTMAKRILTTMGIGPAFFSQITDKECSARTVEGLEQARSRAAAKLNPAQIEEAERFAKRSFPIASLIEVEKRCEAIRNAESGMRHLGKKRGFWNLVIIASVLGFFLLPITMPVLFGVLGSLVGAEEAFSGVFSGMCLGIVAPFIGLIVGLIGKSAATPKEWHGLNKIKKDFIKLLPTPQQTNALYQEAEITPADYPQAKDETLAYRARLNLEGFPDLPAVSEALKLLVTES